MPVSLNAIRTLTIQSKAEGVTDTTAALKGLQTAYDGVTQSAQTTATVTDMASKKQLSIADAYKRQTLALDESARSQDRLSKALKVTDNAMAQGIITQTEYAKRVDLINQKIGGMEPALSLGQKAMGGLRDAATGVSGQLIALSAGAGPVGVFLSALGPWGIAAAVGLGAVSAAMHYVSEESARMGAKAIELQAFKEVTGLTIAQIGALKNAGSDLGVEGDTVVSKFEKLTAGLNAARRASGELYDDVRTVNGALADELQQSTTTAQGINVLSKAYQQAAAASSASGAALSNAIFGGRGGAALGPVLGKIADAGGIDNMTKSTKLLGEATDDQNKKWAVMKAQIDDTNKRAQNILAAIFTTEGLSASLLAAQYMERTAIAASDLAKSKNNLTTFQSVITEIARGAAVMQGLSTDDLDKKVVALGVPKAVLDSWQKYDAQLGTVGTTISTVQAKSDGLTTTLKQQQDAAAAASVKQNELVGFLGSGATVAEKFEQRVRTINSAFLDHKTGAAAAADADGLLGRALAAAGLDKAIALTQALNSILGAAATVQDNYRARIQQIAKAQMESGAATKDQIDNAKRLAMAQADGTFQLQAQIDATKVQTATLGMSVGKAEEFSLIQTKINENLNAGRPALDGVTDAYRKMAAAAGEARDAQEKATINLQIGRDRQTALLSSDDVAIANQLKSIYPDIATALNSAEASAIRFNNVLKSVNDIAGTAFSSMAKDIANGVAPMQAFANAAKQAAASVLDIATKKLTSSLLSSVVGDTTGMTTGATSSAAILTTAGSTLAASMIAGATTAAGILGVGGATAGAEVATGGTVAGGAVAVGGAASGVAQAAGGATGGLAVATSGVAAGASIAIGGVTAATALDAAAAAIGVSTGNIVAVVAAVAAVGATVGLSMFGGGDDDAELNKAKDAWSGMNKEMQSFVDTANGIDFSGPGAQLQSLVDEYDKLLVAAAAAHDVAGMQSAYDSLAKSATRLVDNFSNASDSLSDGAQKIATLKQQAEGLVAVLDRHGGGGLDPEIWAGVAKQIAAIQASIAKGLQADVNSAQGKGFLNDIDDLITKRNQLLSEGNVSSGQISTWFDAMTQKVVDDAGLVGDSFNDLLKTFPDLTGVVHESTDALQKQADAQQELADQQKQAFQSLSKDINDFITNLKFGSNSTLSPSQQFSAAQSDFAAQSTLALGGDQTAAGSITKYADTYLTQARSYLGPSAAFGSISDQVVAALQQILSANKPAGLVNGGLVGSYLGGGIVTNGLYNVDSVVAKYAGGGQIALAGHEYVMPAPQTAENFGTLEAIRSGRGPANDNGEVVAAINALRGDYAKWFGMFGRLLADGNVTDEQILAEIKNARSEQRVGSGAAKARAKVAG